MQAALEGGEACPQGWRRRHLTLATVLGVLLLLVFTVSLGLGRYAIAPSEIAHFVSQWLRGCGKLSPERFGQVRNVIIDVRLPRIIAACLIGAGLATSGAAYQAIFVNPLVSPGLLGVLAGASFGAVLGMVLFKSWYAVQLITFVGGFAGVGLTAAIAIIYRDGGKLILVLGGVVSGAFFTALVSLVKYAADPQNQLPAIVYWLMGNMALADLPTVMRLALPMGLGIMLFLLLGRHLDVLSMGDDEARALGVNTTAIRAAVITTATLVSTLTVVIAGTIGWVGLIVPHAARMLVGPDNRVLLPATALLGALYLLSVDDLSRALFSFELPIGIVTALVGIPFFLLVLRNARRGWS